MKTVNIGSYPRFIKTVREAQGLPQKDIASKLNIWPSALAQYENETASISKEKILLMAPLLNLNPDFIADGNGNPFKAEGNDQVLKMLLLSENDELDLTLLRTIADYSERVTFLFLKPLELPKDKPRLMSKWLRSGSNIYALFVLDDDGNKFIFKRKNDAFFNEKQILAGIEDISRKHILNVRMAGVERDTYNKIHQWGELRYSDFEKYLTEKDDINVLSQLLQVVANRDLPKEEQTELETIKSKIHDISPRQASNVLDRIIPSLIHALHSNV